MVKYKLTYFLKNRLGRTKIIHQIQFYNQYVYRYREEEQVHVI